MLCAGQGRWGGGKLGAGWAGRKLTAWMEDERWDWGHKNCSLRPAELAIIAHGGSSSPGLCISRTGVAGAPCSGRKRPGRPASLRGAVCVDRR